MSCGLKANQIDGFNYNFCDSKNYCIQMDADMAEISKISGEMYLQNLDAKVFKDHKMLASYKVESGLYNKDKKIILDVKKSRVIRLFDFESAN